MTLFLDIFTQTARNLVEKLVPLSLRLPDASILQLNISEHHRDKFVYFFSDLTPLKPEDLIIL